MHDSDSDVDEEAGQPEEADGDAEKPEAEFSSSDEDGKSDMTESDANMTPQVQNQKEETRFLEKWEWQGGDKYTKRKVEMKTPTPKKRESSKQKRAKKE